MINNRQYRWKGKYLKNNEKVVIERQEFFIKVIDAYTKKTISICCSKKPTNRNLRCSAKIYFTKLKKNISVAGVIKYINTKYYFYVDEKGKNYKLYIENINDYNSSVNEQDKNKYNIYSIKNYMLVNQISIYYFSKKINLSYYLTKKIINGNNLLTQFLKEIIIKAFPNIDLI